MLGKKMCQSIDLMKMYLPNTSYLGRIQSLGVIKLLSKNKYTTIYYYK